MLRRRLPALTASLAALTLSLAACGGAGGEDSGPESAGSSSTAGSGAAGGEDSPVAVATTTQLGAVLDRVAACAGARTATVMGPGDDPHDFSASSAQVKDMASSGLVFSNGLGLEGGMESALANVEADGATVVEVAPRLDPLPFGGHDHAEEATGHEGHDHGSEDPHVWMDVARMAKAAELMGVELADARDDRRFAECGTTVRGELEETDRQVREILAEVPEDRRTLVADHDAYGYFGDAYDFTVSGVVVPGGSTDGEPSSQQLAELATSLRDGGADAIITSVGARNGLVDTVAEEAGDLPVIELYEGGVGAKGTPEADYAEAMLFNARTLADALEG